MGPAGAEAYYGVPIQLQPRSTGRNIARTNAIGNPDVQDEQADTVTVGLVLRSQWSNPWLKDLAMTIDWYDIEISNLIALGTQDATYIQCLSLETNPLGDVNDPNCQRVRRDLDFGTLLPTDVTFTNEGRVHTQGYDVQINWGLPPLGFIPGSFSVNVVANFLEKFETQVAADVDPVDFVGTDGSALDLGAGAYRFRTFTTFNYTLNNLRMGLRWRHLPELDDASEATIQNPRVLPIKAYNIFDLTANWRFDNSLRLRAGLQNMFDVLPPRGNIDLDAALPNAARNGGAFYDQLGRRYFLGFTKTF
jgi:outer membrane receptor protein involved in Fe transport